MILGQQKCTILFNNCDIPDVIECLTITNYFNCTQKSAVKVARNQGANAMKPVNVNESTIVTVVFVNNTRSICLVCAFAD
jgi:hypothetical protein